jgi:hypothetical protein
MQRIRAGVDCSPELSGPQKAADDLGPRGPAWAQLTPAGFGSGSIASSARWISSSARATSSSFPAR